MRLVAGFQLDSPTISEVQDKKWCQVKQTLDAYQPQTYSKGADCRLALASRRDAQSSLEAEIIRRARMRHRAAVIFGMDKYSFAASDHSPSYGTLESLQVFDLQCAFLTLRNRQVPVRE